MDTDRARRVIIVAAIALLAVAGLALAVTFTSDPTPVDGEIPIGVADGPDIVLVGDESDVNMEDLWGTGELYVETDSGTIVIGGDDGASARIHVDDIEGPETQLTDIDAGSNWLELDPGDKNRLDVRGDVDTLAFSDIEPDDGAIDIQIGGDVGGSAELRLYDLAADETYGFYDPSRDEFIDSFETDSAGEVTTTVDLPDGTHGFEVRSVGDVFAPVLSSPDPQGQVGETPDSLAVDLQAEGWPVEVAFEFDGEPVETVTVEENGTVEVNIDHDDLGHYEWSATATDALGQTDTLETSFQTPEEITFREEHDPGQIIDDSTVNIRFFTIDGDVSIQRETTDGTVDMQGLPESAFVVYAQSENHYDRTIYIDSVFDQEDMFLLNQTEFPRGENEAVESRFVYEDLTGDFSASDTTIQVQRSIDLDGDGEAEYMTVAGDFFGASTDYQTTLEHGERYRLVLVNQETGERTVAGTHIPTEDLTQTLRVSGLVEDAANESGTVGLAELTDDGTAIDIVYNDPSEATDELRVIVESRSGTEVIYDETHTGPFGTLSEVVALNESQQDEDWVVRFESDNHQSAIPVGHGTVGTPVEVPTWIMTLFGSMAVTFVGALYGPRTALLGAWAMVFVAGGFAMFGWAFSGTSVLVAGLVAVAATLLSRRAMV